MKMKYSISSKIVLLVILFISFIIKYHTNTSKSKKRSLSFPFNHSIISTTKSSIIPAPFSTAKASRSTSNEKYITFFTHSGFQNQLIQGNSTGIVVLFLYCKYLIVFVTISGEWNPVSLVSKSDTDFTKGFIG